MSKHEVSPSVTKKAHRGQPARPDGTEQSATTVCFRLTHVSSLSDASVGCFELNGAIAAVVVIVIIISSSSTIVWKLVRVPTTIDSWA